MANVNESGDGVKGSPDAVKGIKMVKLGDILTDDEIKCAFKCKTAQEIADIVIGPAIDRINKVTGQENDPLYLAYAIQFGMTGGVR